MARADAARAWPSASCAAARADAARYRADNWLRCDAWNIGGVGGCAVAGAMAVKMVAAKAGVQL
jgi:hypothetical protein